MSNPSRASALVDPDVELEPVTATVHPFSDVEDVEINDHLCPGTAREIGASKGTDGNYLVVVGAVGMLRTSATSSSSVTIPASRIRLVDGDRTIARDGPEKASAAFTLDAPPGRTARIEVDLDGRTVSAPVRVRECD